MKTWVISFECMRNLLDFSGRWGVGVPCLCKALGVCAACLFGEVDCSGEVAAFLSVLTVRFGHLMHNLNIWNHGAG